MRASRRLFLVVLALAPLPATSAARSAKFPVSGTRRIDRLLQMIQQRLDHAPVVAEARWKSMTRIEDSFGEQMAIDAARTQSARIGLDPEFGARFAQAQIDAGKSIQAARHRQWTLERSTAPARHADGPPAPGASASVIRFQSPPPEPALPAPMLSALRDAAGILRRRGGRALLDARAADLIQIGGADLLAGQIALKPLYDIAN